MAEEPKYVQEKGKNSILLFLKKSTEPAMYQYAHLKYPASHSFSLIFSRKYSVLKRKFLKEYQYFDTEREKGKLHKAQEQYGKRSEHSKNT